MAKFCGNIGYAVSTETVPGVWAAVGERCDSLPRPGAGRPCRESNPAGKDRPAGHR